MEMKKFNYVLEIDILGNSSQIFLGVLRGAFLGLGVQKDTQTPCWLRLWYKHIGTIGTLQYCIYCYGIVFIQERYQI